MKPIPALACAIAAFAVLTPLSARAHERHHDRDDFRFHRPWFGPAVRTTVVYDASPRYSSYRSIEVDVQRALARRGYYHGPIDGDIGYGTIRAIRAYQYQHDLPVSGRIDRYLIRSLGL